MFKWSIIQSISNSKMIASSTIWVFVVPMLLHIYNFLTNNVCNNVLCFNSSLYLLYFSGFLFFVGGFAFLLLCPKFLQDFSNYADFVNKGGNHLTVESYISDFNNNESSLLYSKLSDKIEENQDSDIDDEKVVGIKIGDFTYIFKKEQIDEVFWVVHEYFQNKTKFMWLSAIPYILGMICLLWIFYKNFIYVLNSLVFAY